ncbi:hypothetical protein AKJ16_DCAP05967 [Drosera capensis]
MTENSDSNHEVEDLNSMVWNSMAYGSLRMYQREKRKRIEETKCRIEELPHDVSVIIKASGDKHDRSFPISDSPLTTAIGTRKKLLVLDLNGLLADIVASSSEEFTPDTTISRKALFKRPFCDEFLNFCFERFSVGIWSSRMRKNVDLVVNFLMGSAKRNCCSAGEAKAVVRVVCYGILRLQSVSFNYTYMVFITLLQDQSHCTKTGYNTIENNGKPLILKELTNYGASKAWVYHRRTEIRMSPIPCCWMIHRTRRCVILNLRIYLERLADADDVQAFVEASPFGQSPITD